MVFKPVFLVLNTGLSHRFSSATNEQVTVLCELCQLSPAALGPAAEQGHS